MKHRIPATPRSVVTCLLILTFVTPRVFLPSPNIQSDGGYQSTSNCIPIDDSLPTDIHPSGALVFYDLQRSQSRVYDFQARVDRQSPFPFRPYKPSEYASSPNGKWMAYIDYTYDASGHALDGRSLVIRNVEGRKINLSYWTQDWQWIFRWLDDTHLALQTPQYSPDSLLILNPFTGAWRAFTPQLPNIEDRRTWKVPSWPNYNAALSHIVYVTSNKESNGNYHRGITLLDLQTNKPLWRMEGARYSGAVWSPDGKQFGILKQDESQMRLYLTEGKSLFNFYLIGLDGKEEVVFTNTQWDAFGGFGWSPDGKRLAVWGNADASSTTTPLSHLMLVDVPGRALTDLCITQDYVSHMFPKTPLWSPDSRFLAISLHHGDVWVFETVLVDVEHQRAFRLGENMVPIDWMSKP